VSENQFSNSPTTPTNNKNNQLTEAIKSQIHQYLVKNGISKISLENGKLVIEYNIMNNTTRTIENEDQQLQKYRQLIQALPSQSLSLSELQKNKTNNSASAPNKDNTGTYIGLAIGVFVLGGIFVYFLVHKRKNK
jgi:ATP-dependent Zn protease